MKCGIYGLQNKLKPEKWYIGCSIDVEKRWHKGYYLMQCKKQKKIYNALLKYGYDGFEKVILEECSREFFEKKETYWVAKYDSVKTGYNLAPGGEGGFRPIGIPCSEETKKKIGNANRGRKHTDEAKLLMSIAGKGKPKPEGFGETLSKAIMGHTMSEETKNKIRESNKKAWTDERRKRWGEFMSKSMLGKTRGPYKKVTLTPETITFYSHPQPPPCRPAS